MLKVASKNLSKWSQTYYDPDDIDEETLRRRQGIPNQPTPPRQPQPKARFINDENYEQYEPSTIDSQPEQPDWMGEVPTGRDLVPENSKEIEYDIGLENVPPEQQQEASYDSVNRLIDDGLKQREVIGFEYILKNGKYGGRRIVEPHYTFIPYTTDSGEILVTYDLTRENDPNGAIRAFIIKNIQPQALVRYEGAYFDREI